MRFRYLSLGAVAIGIVLVGSASPAHADIVDGGSGCSGTGGWLKSGLFVDAATKGRVYVIPRSDTVHWAGSVKSGSEGTYNGSISVDLPFPFGEVLIDDWSGEYETTGNEGDHKYDLPSMVPAGVEFELHGKHTDKKGGCTGTVIFKIDGGPFDSPIIFAVLGGLALFLGATAWALKPLFQKTPMSVGRIGLAAILAMFLMLFVGVLLVLFGVIPLNSIIVSILPVVGLLGVGALSFMARSGGVPSTAQPAA